LSINFQTKNQEFFQRKNSIFYTNFSVLLFKNLSIENSHFTVDKMAIFSEEKIERNFRKEIEIKKIQAVYNPTKFEEH